MLFLNYRDALIALIGFCSRTLPQILMNSLTLYAVISHFVKILSFLRSLLKVYPNYKPWVT